MATALAPAPSGRPVPTKTVRSLRVLVGLALLVCCVLAIVEAGAVRNIEAMLAEPLVDAVTSGHSTTSRDVILFGLGTNGATGLRISPECTVLVMLLPIGAVVGLLVMFSRLSVPRLFLGGALGALAAILVNQLRIALIAFSLQEWGIDPGYKISHTFVGSVFAIIGFTLAFLILMKVAVKDKNAGHVSS